MNMRIQKLLQMAFFIVIVNYAGAILADESALRKIDAWEYEDDGAAQLAAGAHAYSDQQFVAEIELAVSAGSVNLIISNGGSMLKLLVEADKMTFGGFQGGEMRSINTPGATGLHTRRVEIDPNKIKLFIDGKLAAETDKLLNVSIYLKTDDAKKLSDTERAIVRNGGIILRQDNGKAQIQKTRATYFGSPASVANIPAINVDRKIKWEFSYDAAAGRFPSSELWKAQYKQGNAVVCKENGRTFLRLNHNETGDWRWQLFSLNDPLGVNQLGSKILTQCRFRYAGGLGADLSKYFLFSISVIEEGEPVTALVQFGKNGIYTNFGDYPWLKLSGKIIDVELEMDVKTKIAVLRIDGKGVIHGEVKMSPGEKPGIVWGDGGIDIAGIVEIESFRVGTIQE